ncbi:unnamed protein product [Rotaria sp. Silwood2]|nr:unnamed protein product [Rotaria sp. Silwood2]CAF4316464.1 unnamed protein product [Rotaria sp. Silwood2]CAF4446864.1 unnamed protein product [Rotaria sp. Silwood2]
MIKGIARDKRYFQNFGSSGSQMNEHAGTVLVTKNPCLHPGDIRKLKAVYVPKLQSCIRDGIVFSSNGHRPSFNEMTGADLGGYQYWAYWDDEFQIEEVVKPLFYSLAKKNLDTAPGIIANTHSVIADKHSDGTLSKECEECALLFARAIDARKTGENINLTSIMRLIGKYCQIYPEWMMKFGTPKMDPPSMSINEILHRKAQDA